MRGHCSSFEAVERLLGDAAEDMDEVGILPDVAGSPRAEGFVQGRLTEAHVQAAERSVMEAACYCMRDEGPHVSSGDAEALDRPPGVVSEDPHVVPARDQRARKMERVKASVYHYIDTQAS